LENKYVFSSSLNIITRTTTTTTTTPPTTPTTTTTTTSTAGTDNPRHGTYPFD